MVWCIECFIVLIILSSSDISILGARFNNDLYTQYTKPGMSFDYGVWPLLRQSKGGQVISKGIAQGI